MNDKIIKKLIDHDEEFVRVRDEMKQYHNEVLDRLDSIMVIVQRLDQERLFTFEIVKRMQKDIENQQKEINKVSIK